MGFTFSFTSFMKLRIERKTSSLIKITSFYTRSVLYLKVLAFFFVIETRARVQTLIKNVIFAIL